MFSMKSAIEKAVHNAMKPSKPLKPTKKERPEPSMKISHDTKRIDLDKLTPTERKRVERAMDPRDRVMSMRFSGFKVDAWKAASKTAGVTFTSWIEDACDAALKKQAKR